MLSAQLVVYRKFLGSTTDWDDYTAYIQQVIWAKKYLSRKNEGFREAILNSKILLNITSN